MKNVEYENSYPLFSFRLFNSMFIVIVDIGHSYISSPEKSSRKLYSIQSKPNETYVRTTFIHFPLSPLLACYLSN